MRTDSFLRAGAAVTLFSLFTLSAGHAQQRRSVGNFDKLKASGACDVVLVQGATTEVKVVTDGELERYIKTEVQNGTLTIYRDKDAPSSWFGTHKVTVYVTCPRLSGIETSGACDIKSTSTFEADNFTIKASGASDVTLGLNTRLLTVTASGASDVELRGRADRQQVRLSGSSDYKATNLQSQQADVQASGSSDAYVSAAQLTSHASGASDIYNRGRAQR
ncbi:head GIN domain-containing protein [Hymenobacter rubripertinctus]|nr:head GIN domain-containing protein [Hymenobacter rubripertinctus]